ncbi:MAG: PepSY domain-containing protein [Planctomycetaceae bacterium]|nr:PepSY domain-containing protein [Planctomycetaceae bacterium]
MNFRRTMRRLHLWLGLAAGSVVFVVALSGSVYVFEREIQDWLQGYRHVDAVPRPTQPPSRLRAIAEQQLAGETASRVYYEGPARAAYVQFGDMKSRYYKLVYVNPYDGRVLKVKDMNHDFFHLVFSLHYRLLLSPDVGTTIVDCATLVFVVILLSGLVNWFPRSWAVVRQRLFIRWRAPWSRKNYDLHNVLGFHGFPVMLVVALTGLVWGFAWFDDAVHWIVSGGAETQRYEQPASKGHSTSSTTQAENVDAAWARLASRYPNAETIIVFFPQTAEASIRYVVNPDRYTYYKTDHYYYDQQSLAELEVSHDWGKYEDATRSAWVRRANFDIHIGAILGLPGKILAFVAGMIAASLPVTGFLIWWRKWTASRRHP